MLGIMLFMDRKEELLGQVVDHVLEHGLIGLTLRPLAAAIGTSDRMLIYHFGGRDELVAAVVARTNELSVAAVAALEPAEDVRAGVEALWRAYRTEPLHSCLQVYLQAAATGLIRPGGMMLFTNAVRAPLVPVAVSGSKIWFVNSEKSPWRIFAVGTV